MVVLQVTFKQHIIDLDIALFRPFTLLERGDYQGLLQYDPVSGELFATFVLSIQ